MRMVSHPESLAEQFLFVNEDGVPSWSLAEQFLFVNEDGVPSWSWHQKLQEEEAISGNVTIYASVQHHNNPGHGTRNARGFPLPVYINVYVCILISKSILQSSIELAHAGYIYMPIASKNRPSA